jgi:ABC-type polysaccharide/polyol phosphate export permease
MKGLMYFNPLFYFVISFQYLIILDQIPPPDILVTGAIFSVFVFVLGFSVFRRSKQVFYDFA